MRIFRTYTRVAQIQHWCDRCCDYIEPGETYEGSVELFDGHRLFVFKNHLDPMCDYPPDPEDENQDFDLEVVPVKQAA